MGQQAIAFYNRSWSEVLRCRRAQTTNRRARPVPEGEDHCRRISNERRRQDRDPVAYCRRKPVQTMGGTSGIIRDGSSKGFGNALFNVKDGVVRDGSSLGFGKTIGKISDFTIKGMERELDAEIVAAYHFLVKKIV
jgi:hypothetical protein